LDVYPSYIESFAFSCRKCKVRNSLRLPENVSNFLEHHESNPSVNERISRDAGQEVGDEEVDVQLLQFDDFISTDGG